MAEEDEGTRLRQEAFFKAPFMPIPSRTAPHKAEERAALALEYIAHHIGKIDERLSTITEAVKELVRNSRT